MGQGSSLEVSSPVPTGSRTDPQCGTLMVDASDSFVSDLKLRSTGIIPISEYIKKEKYKKNVQRLEQVKKVEQTLPQSEAAEPKGSKQDEQDDESKADEELRPRRSRKKGSDFIETSYEDVPENRVWIIKPSSRHRSSVTKRQDVPKKAPSLVVHAEPENYSDHLIIPQKTKHTKNKVNTPNTIRPVEKHTKHTATSDDDPPELRELYHRKHRENHHRQKKAKRQRNAETSSTDLLKSRHMHNTDTRSTHNVNNHHFKLLNFAHRAQKAPKLTVQTNLSCTIPPNRYLIPCLKKSWSGDRQHGAYHLKIARQPVTSNAKKNLRFATPPRSVERIEMACSSLSLTPEDVRNDVPQRGLSARQALESWKNIHVQKYRERSRTMSPSPPDRAQVPLAANSNETSRDSDERPICRPPARPGSRNHHQNLGGGYYHKGGNSSTVVSARRDKCLQTDCHSPPPSKEFLDDIERCLQRHSHLSDLYIKRNGGAKSTWVQDKYRRWHKITFEDN